MLSNIIKHRLHVHFCLLAFDPELLALTFTQASQLLRPPSTHHPSYPYKECPPSRFSGAPSVSVCPGRRAPGLRSTESKLDFPELCHVSAVLFDCNIVKLPIELLQNGCTSFENHVFPPQKHPPLFIYCLFCAIICINWSTS